MTQPLTDDEAREGCDCDRYGPTVDRCPQCQPVREHLCSSNGNGVCRVCGAEAPPPWPVTSRHNHLTRDIKPEGQCPRCDLHWEASREDYR